MEQAEGSAARLADYGDSAWETGHDLRARLSPGFSFMGYRIHVTFPHDVDGHPVQGGRVQLETCIDDDGERWIDGEYNRDRGVS